MWTDVQNRNKIRLYYCTALKLLESMMPRPEMQKTKLDARIAKLRREVLQAERTLAREIKKREMPCRCHQGESEFSQEDFEEFREIFEVVRTSWLAKNIMETDTLEVGNA